MTTLRDRRGAGFHERPQKIVRPEPPRALAHVSPTALVGFGMAAWIVLLVGIVIGRMVFA
jgi:hypothetical protein